MKQIGIGIVFVAAAFVITSALMFWVPILQRSLGYDVYDYEDVYGDYYPVSDALVKRTPAADRVSQE